MVAVAITLMVAAISSYRYSTGDAALFLSSAVLLSLLSYAVYAGWSSAQLQDAVVANVVVERLKTEEGFRAKPYRDTRGFLTVGYGTNLDAGILHTTGECMARSELETKLARLRKLWPPFDTMPAYTQIALLDMAYQEGVHGVLGFHDMLAALIAGDCHAAQSAALDSVWARETQKRAEGVASLFCR